MAFPAISTGVYGYPKDQAARVAVNTVCDVLKSNDIAVTFVCYDAETLRLYEALL